MSGTFCDNDVVTLLGRCDAWAVAVTNLVTFQSVAGLHGAGTGFSKVGLSCDVCDGQTG